MFSLSSKPCLVPVPRIASRLVAKTENKLKQNAAERKEQHWQRSMSFASVEASRTLRLALHAQHCLIG